MQAACHSRPRLPGWERLSVGLHRGSELAGSRARLVRARPLCAVTISPLSQPLCRGLSQGPDRLTCGPFTRWTRSPGCPCPPAWPPLEGLWEKVLDVQACRAASLLTSAALTVPGDVVTVQLGRPRPCFLGLLPAHGGTWPTAWFPPDAHVCPEADPPPGMPGTRGHLGREESPEWVPR